MARCDTAIVSLFFILKLPVLFGKFFLPFCQAEFIEACVYRSVCLLKHEFVENILRQAQYDITQSQYDTTQSQYDMTSQKNNLIL
jgi:hypothetical protein